MPSEIVIPLWGKLVLLSLAKKATVVGLAYVYGFPRLYRRSQKLVRFVTKDPAVKQSLGGYVRTAFRLPAKLLHSKPVAPRSPALQYLAALPNRLLPVPPQQLKHKQAEPAGSSWTSFPSRAAQYSFASSPMLQRQAESMAASRERLSSLRERFRNHPGLRSLVEARAERMTSMWQRFKQQPHIFVPSVQ